MTLLSRFGEKWCSRLSVLFGVICYCLAALALAFLGDLVLPHWATIEGERGYYVWRGVGLLFLFPVFAFGATLAHTYFDPFCRDEPRRHARMSLTCLVGFIVMILLCRLLFVVGLPWTVAELLGGAPVIVFLLYKVVTSP